jgi:acyl carrier protein
VNAQTDTATDTAELRQRVLDSMAEVLPRLLQREEHGLPESTRLMEDLGLTSTTTLELMLELEDNLDIQIDVEEIDQENLASIGTLADFIATHAQPA